MTTPTTEQRNDAEVEITRLRADIDGMSKIMQRTIDRLALERDQARADFGGAVTVIENLVRWSDGKISKDVDAKSSWKAARKLLAALPSRDQKE